MPTPLTDADKVLRNDTGKDIVEKLDDIAQALGVGAPASSVTYDNTDSGLTADDVQEAVDELASEKADKSELTSSYFSGTTNDSGSTIPAGRFFYLNGALVVAIADILDGATFTLDTNYTAVTAGVLNSLSSLPTVTPTSSDKLIVVQSQGQGLVPYGSKLDSANPTGTGSLSLNKASGSTLGANAVSLGTGNTASGESAVALGNGNTASGQRSFASGYATTAQGQYSIAEGYNTTSSGSYGCRASGNSTIANHVAQNVFGAYNVADTSSNPATQRGTYVEIVGNGTGGSARSNARTLDWSGNEVLAGDCTIKGNKSLDAVTTKHAITITAEQDVASNVAVTGGEINGLVAFMAQLRVTASANAWTDIATINYKPSITFSGLVLRNGTGTPNGMIQILSSGVVRIFPTSALSTNDVSFVACYST